MGAESHLVTHVLAVFLAYLLTFFVAYLLASTPPPVFFPSPKANHAQEGPGGPGARNVIFPACRSFRRRPLKGFQPQSPFACACRKIATLGDHLLRGAVASTPPARLLLRPTAATLALMVAPVNALFFASRLFMFLQGSLQRRSGGATCWHGAARRPRSSATSSGAKMVCRKPPGLGKTYIYNAQHLRLPALIARSRYFF